MSQFYQQQQRRKFLELPPPAGPSVIRVRPGEWCQFSSAKYREGRKSRVNPISILNRWACQPRKHQ